MSDHVYKVIELVGSSPTGIEDAIQGAIARAGQTISGLDWFEVKEVRGMIKEGHAGWYQVKIAVGFRVLEPADLHKEG